MKLLSLGDDTVYRIHQNFSRSIEAELVDLTYKHAGIQTIYRYLIKYLCENYDPTENYCAIVAIPDNKRLELREDQDKKIDFFDRNYFVYYPKTKDLPKLTYTKLRKFNGQIFQTELVRARQRVFIYAIEKILDAYQIPHLFYNLNEPIVDSIATKNYFEPYNTKKVRDTAFLNGENDVSYAEQLSEYYNDNNN